MVNAAYSYNEMTSRFYAGLVSQRDYELYCVAWHWLNYRLSSHRQEAFIKRYGFDALKARINRFRVKLDLNPL